MNTIKLSLNTHYKHIFQNVGWKNKFKIIGEAVENYIVYNLPCPVCNENKLEKYKQNEKSRDASCKNCKCQLQIKASKMTNVNKKITILKLLGASYTTTLASIKNNNVHFVIVYYYVDIYNYYHVSNIYFVNSKDINENCIEMRKPLSATAKRAGWVGCNLVFKKFKSIHIN